MKNLFKQGNIKTITPLDKFKLILTPYEFSFENDGIYEVVTKYKKKDGVIYIFDMTWNKCKD